MSVREGGRAEFPTGFQRVIVLGVVLVALVALVSVDRSRSDRATLSVTAARADVAQVDRDVPNQTWFCPGGPLGANATTSVEVANIGDEPAEVAVSAVGDAAALTFGIPVPAGRVAQTVPARTVVSFDLNDIVAANYAGAIVESRGASIVASMHVIADGGYGATPCARDTSSSWFAADGSTVRGARLTYFLLNPFPSDAVVDVAFATSAGRRTPDETQALLVPGRSVAVVEVDKVVLRAEHVAAEAHVRRGRVVMGRLSQFGDESGRSGTAVSTATPRASTAWYFAHGAFDEGRAQRVALYNPNDVEADVLVGVPMDDDVVDPFEAKVPAHGYELVQFSGQDRVRAGQEHSIVVESVNGVGVVAERWIDGTAGAALGVALGFGVSAPAKQWIVPGVERGGASTTVWVANFGTASATLTLDVLHDGQIERPPSVQAIQVEPGHRVPLPIPADGAEGFAAIAVNADQPVVVQADRVAAGGKGIGTTAGVPIRSLTTSDG